MLFLAKKTCYISLNKQMNAYTQFERQVKYYKIFLKVSPRLH